MSLARPMTRTRGRQARRRLTAALVRAAARGERTPCSDSDTHHYWTSDYARERALAARRCAGCPVLSECYAVGEHESFGVYGGHDFSPRAYLINTDTSHHDQ